MVVRSFWTEGDMDVGEFDHWFYWTRFSGDFFFDSEYFLGKVLYLFLRIKGHELRTLDVFLLLFHVLEHLVDFLNDLLF